MKRQLSLLIFLLINSFIISCSFYHSKIPISDSKSSTINNQWIDHWVILDGNEDFLYPRVEIKVQAFNQKEYVATVMFLEQRGQIINSVTTYKIHNSKIDSCEFLNIQNLDNRTYFFYKIEQDLEDSLIVRVLNDSLKLEFEASSEVRKFLKNVSSIQTDKIFSPPFSFNKWKSLNWDKIYKQDKTQNFDKFYSLGKLDEEHFKDLTTSKLNELVKNKNGKPLAQIITYFNKIQFTSQRNDFWKSPRYAVIKLKNGEFIKLKIDLNGPLIKDLTNGLLFSNKNKVKWK